MRVVVIEDNKDMLENIVEILELNDFEVYPFSDGREALKQLEMINPDAIVCDIMMPKIDGYTIYAELQKNENLKHIPFIFLTAKSDKQDVRKGMNLGADDYITKPFEEKDLVEALKKRIEKKNSIYQWVEKKLNTIEKWLSEISVEKTLKQPENRRIRHLKTKETLFQQGDPAYFLYLLKKGKIKESKLAEDGKELITHIYQSGEFIGYVDLILQQTHTNEAVALEDSEVVLIPSDEFYQLLNKNAHIAEEFIKLLAGQSQEKEKKLIELAYQSVRKRIAIALLELAKIQQSNTFKASRQDLAAMAGTAVETAIRILSEFNKDGYIQSKGSTITLLQPEKLKNLPF